MKLIQKLSVAPPRIREPWVTQEMEWDAWMARVQRRGKPNTKRNLEMYTRPLYEMFHPALVAQLGEDDMRNFLAALEPKCSRFMNGDEPLCRKGIDIATCPMLTGAPRASCLEYHALRVGGVMSYLDAVSQMYEWFLKEQRLPAGNPMLGVRADYKDKHRATIDQLADNPDRRDLTLEEVCLLVQGSPPGHAVVYFMAAKFFLRIHEALRMSFDPQYCNIEEGWMVIPPGQPDEPHKRRGNHTVILDREAKNYLERYRETYWLPNVRLDSRKRPVTQRIALTSFGLPYAGKYMENNFNQQCLQKDAVRLGIMLGDEERGERVTTHCFRSFALSYANDRQCPQIDGWLLMGDKVQGPAGRYDNYCPRLPEIYRKYAPVLGI